METVVLNLTVRELAEKLNVDYPVCYGLCKYLEKKGLIKATGTKPAQNAKGKGKPSTIYEVPTKIELWKDTPWGLESV